MTSPLNPESDWENATPVGYKQVRKVTLQFNLADYLTRQREFSKRTFGPRDRTAGLLDHIGKELDEIRQAPHDLMEWVDVMILAFDGALNQGYSPQEITNALLLKQEKNEERRWPDWRTSPEGKAIEHIRTGE